MLNQKAKSKAFTIVELLTVISVITLIIGLLVPALNKVNRIAKDMKQRAQFHAMTTALEMFKTENGEYPSSSLPTNPTPTSDIICGAHKLAEALLGRDLQGFDPQTNMDDPIDTSNNPYGYSGTTVDSALFEKSLDRRKGPYLNMDNLSAFDLGQIYGTSRMSSTLYYGYGTSDPNAPVITDIYKATSVLVNNKTVSVGTPILYYKANIAAKFNDITTNSNAALANSAIYNIYDNDEIVKLGSVKESKDHKILANPDYKYFYEEMIANPSVPRNGNKTRPYRPDSYILISAGYDGIYGTNDDITNYEE